MLEFMIQYSRDAGKSDAAREKKNFMSARIEGTCPQISIHLEVGYSCIISISFSIPSVFRN